MVTNVVRGVKFHSEEFDSGRMSVFNFRGNDGLIITTGTNLEGDGAQDNASSFGKVLFIDYFWYIKC